MSKLITFTYHFGGNIELTVEAEFSPPEPDVNFHGSTEIVSVKLPNGDEVEIDDICIKDRYGYTSLEHLLIDAAGEWVA